MISQGADVGGCVVGLVLDGLGGPFADDEMGFDVELSKGQEYVDPDRGTGCAGNSDNDLFSSWNLFHFTEGRDEIRPREGNAAYVIQGLDWRALVTCMSVVSGSEVRMNIDW